MGDVLGVVLGVDGVKRADGRWFDMVVADDEVSLLHPIKRSEIQFVNVLSCS